MEAAVNAAYACQIFQGSCVALAMMAQVFVGRWKGAGDWKSIRPGIWQFIWFSILSTVLTLPLSILYGIYYFHGTDIEFIVKPYYYLLVSINFLYPLAATLTCFYLGQGKTLLILCATIGSQILKLTLAYLLIFGWSDWLPAFGLLGGVLSTFIAQGCFCAVLFFVFLNRKNVDNYNTHEWKFQPKLFWECIHPGILRAFTRILNFLCWASVSHLMTAKGGDHLLMLSIGGSLFLFIAFLGDAICQTQVTVVSQILGSKNYAAMSTAFRSGFILVLISVGLLGIPLLLFPSISFYYLFPNIILSDSAISTLFFGVWVSAAFYTYGFLPISYILAFKDTKFSLFMGTLNWINGFLLMYISIEVVKIPADQFWLVLSLMHASTALLYLWRMKWLDSRLALSLA